MKPEELAMLVIAYDGMIDTSSAIINFPKTIPEWVRSMLDDFTNLKENPDDFICAFFDYSEDKVAKDVLKMNKVKELVSGDKKYLNSIRYLAPERSVNYVCDICEYLDFIHLYYQKANEEYLIPIDKKSMSGAEESLYKIFGVLTFICEWCSSKYVTIEDSSIIFECNRKELPCEFTGTDLNPIGVDFVEVLPGASASFSGIEYIKIPFTNVWKAIEAWFNDSKDYRNDYIEFLRNEQYLKGINSDNDKLGELICNASRAYLVKHHDFSKKTDEDVILSQLLSIFSIGKYKIFIREKDVENLNEVYKYVPTTVTHSVAAGNGCFSELRLLINHSSYWYIDIHGNISTTDINTVDTDEVIVNTDGAKAVENIMNFQRVYFSKTPLRMISMVLQTQLSMRTVAREHSTISYKEAEPIKDIDLLMYFANYYVQNSLDNMNEFFDWWGHVSHGVKFADSEICRNLDVLTDFFNDEQKIITLSDEESINDKIWNVGLYGIYIFTIRCEIESSNTLTEDQKNRLHWVRYSISSKIREIRNFPWERVKTPTNRLIQIAEDPQQNDGIALIMAAASLNIDTYTIYPAYQYFIRTLTKDMIMQGFAELDIVKKGSFEDIYHLLRTKLSCNTVPMNIYRLAILTIRSILCHRKRDIEKDVTTYLNCLRILDNKFVSYKEKNPLTVEYYTNTVIGQEVGLKIVNYLEMNDLAKQVEEDVRFLEKNRIFENWTRIMQTKTIMNRDNIGVFNESMIQFLNILK